MIGTVNFGSMTVEQVVNKMRENILKGRNNPQIRKLAGQIVKKIESRDRDLVAKNVYQFLRLNIKYTNDPRGGEYLQDPIAVLKTQTGDCDEFTTLGASLLESIGVKTRIVIVKQNNQPTFSHVYLQYWSDRFKRWIAFDAIVDKYPGWEGGAITEKRIYDLQTGKPVRYADIGAGEAAQLVENTGAATAGAFLGLDPATSIAVWNATKKQIGKYFSANWWTGKKSLWNKWFGKGYSISADKANQALYDNLHDAVGYEKTDFAKFERRHKGAFSVYVKWWDGETYKSRFGDGGTAEMIREIGEQLARTPKPGFPSELFKAEAQKFKQAQAAINTPNQPANITQATGQDWPVMPANPAGINSVDYTALIANKAQTTGTAGQIYLKAKSLGINDSAPTPGASIMYVDVVKYWNQVNEYRNRVIAKAQAGQGGNGNPVEVQEAGMSTGAKIGLGVLGAGVLFAVAKAK